MFLFSKMTDPELFSCLHLFNQVTEFLRLILYSTNDKLFIKFMIFAIHDFHIKLIVVDFFSVAE